MPSPTDVGPSAWWWCMALGPGDRPAWFAVVLSDARPPTTLAELPLAEAERAVAGDAVCTIHYGPDLVPDRVTYASAYVPDAPSLWFHEVAEPDGTPPASSLVAFTGHGIEPGRLAVAADLRGKDVASADQVGAVRWYVGTGEVDQIYVAPAHRRKGVATILTVVGGTLSLARGQARWWGDGQRTAMGESWVRASSWMDRAASQTHLAPPMTPFDQR